MTKLHEKHELQILWACYRTLCATRSIYSDVVQRNISAGAVRSASLQLCEVKETQNTGADRPAIQPIAIRSCADKMKLAKFTATCNVPGAVRPARSTKARTGDPEHSHDKGEENT